MTDPSLVLVGIAVVALGATACALLAHRGMRARARRGAARAPLRTGALTGASASTPRGAASGAQRDPSQRDLQRVALAAFAFHRSRRALEAPPPSSSPWSSAGRMRQLARHRH